MSEPLIRDNPRFIDDRGIIDQVYNKDLPFDIKRVYIIKHQGTVIRAYHGHKLESKALFCPKGSFKIIAFPMSDDCVRSEEKKEFVISEAKNNVVIIPSNYYHGFINLEPNSTLFVFSNLILEDSKNDDYRLPWSIIGEDVWKVKFR